MTEPLKLRGEDEEDLKVIAACLQDAIVSIGDMVFLPKEKRFVAMLNRFRWEARATPDPSTQRGRDAPFAEGAERTLERVHCALRFDRVVSVQAKAIDRRRRGDLLELLTMQSEGKAIQLVFARGASVLLTVEAIRCLVEDIGDGWSTARRPHHATDEIEVASE